LIIDFAFLAFIVSAWAAAFIAASKNKTVIILFIYWFDFLKLKLLITV
jgi:hypothetical protein